MGFAKNWINLIMSCVSTISYSVNINGMGTFFRSTKRLHQRDPLSPFLFLIYSESLSFLVRLAIRESCLKGVKASSGGPSISHLQFANDCILFRDVTSYEVKSVERNFESV